MVEAPANNGADEGNCVGQVNDESPDHHGYLVGICGCAPRDSEENGRPE